MKRFQFLASMLGLGALAKAQNSTSSSTRIDIGTDGTRSIYPRPNGECPHCGMKAAKIGRPVFGSTIRPGDPVTGALLVENKYGVRDEAIVRCQRCNSAFWQDTE